MIINMCKEMGSILYDLPLRESRREDQENNTSIDLEGNLYFWKMRELKQTLKKIPEQVISVKYQQR